MITTVELGMPGIDQEKWLDAEAMAGGLSIPEDGLAIGGMRMVACQGPGCLSPGSPEDNEFGCEARGSCAYK